MKTDLGAQSFQYVSLDSIIMLRISRCAMYSLGSPESISVSHAPVFQNTMNANPIS